jgi:glycosyltransferase involved in cell wall biosynthesis
MKTVMVFPNPSSEKGISSYSINLVKNLRKQGVKVDDITFMQGKPLTLFSQFSEIVKKDVIHIQHEYNLLGGFGLPYFLLLGLLRIMKKKALVVTMHTVLSQNEQFKSGKVKTRLRKILYQLQNRWINYTSDKIIVHARAFKKILVEEYSISEKKIEVLPHPILESIKTLSKEKAKKELNLDGHIYLLIGTMIPDHGHDIITRQANKIGRTILIVTNPDAINDRNVNKIKDFLELNQRIVRENHFEDFVRFDLGFVSYEKWWKYFSASDIVLLPYRGGIGSGIFADAMAAKKPVIASNVRYFKEFAEDYGCIKLAKDDKDFPKIINKSMEPQTYKEMIGECERYLKENGITPISKKYKKLYESLI